MIKETADSSVEEGRAVQAKWVPLVEALQKMDGLFLTRKEIEGIPGIWWKASAVGDKGGAEARRFCLIDANGGRRREALCVSKFGEECGPSASNNQA